MNSYNSVRNWFDLRGLPVYIPSEGRNAGSVEDFYYKVGTNAVSALRIKTRLSGFELLTTNVISTIDQKAVTIANQEMLIDESNGGDITELPLGNTLLGFNVLSESGTLLGTIENILLATYPALALRIAAYQLAGGKIFYAKEVTNYGRNELYVLDKAAKRL